MNRWNNLQCEWAFNIFVFGGFIHNTTLESHFSCFKILGHIRKTRCVCVALNSYKLQMIGFETQEIKLVVCVATRLFGFMHWVWSFAQTLCGALFVFLFMKLQLLGVTIGGCLLVFFGLKKTFELFCDFVFVCGFNSFKSWTSMRAWTLKLYIYIYINKREPMFSHKGPYLFSFSFSFPLSLFGRINRR